MIRFIKSIFITLISLIQHTITKISSFFKLITYTVYLTFLHLLAVMEYWFGGSTIVKNTRRDSEIKNYVRTFKALAREDFLIFLSKKKYMDLDRIEIYWVFINFTKSMFDVSTNSLKIIQYRYFYRIKNYNYKPYNHFYKNVTTYDLLQQYKSNYLFGLKSMWMALRPWIISLVLSLASIYYLSVLRSLPVNTTLFQWFTLTMFSYWLISGFVFFIKKYQFSRFTTAIQRFWRRSYILFWLIESCLLLVFFYLTVNSSQESPYMLDQIQVYKTHLFSWRSFLPKLFLVSAVIFLGYFLLLSIKWNISKKNIPLVLTITLLLTYLLWVEFYQIYHVSNFYANFFWNYDLDERIWSLENDVRRTRIVNHYIMILFILKFWHIVFIYGFWVFFVLRARELGRIRYPIYSANFQNFIILYIMSWLFMYPWFKVTFHRFLEVPYNWFMVNNRELGLRIFFYDIKLIILSFFENLLNSTNSLFFFKNYKFFYFILTNEDTNYLTYRKHWIRENIYKSLSR